MKKRHKIFIAINLPHDIRDYLSRFEKKFSDLPAQWSKSQNLHITLIFLGYLSDVEMGDVCMAVKEVANIHHSFSINLETISYAPKEKLPPKMIWANGQKIKELSNLKRDIEKRIVEKIHFKPEERSFSPHITLAKIKTFEWRAINPEERQDVNESLELSFDVDSVEVMESVLKKSGPEYVMVESYQLL